MRKVIASLAESAPERRYTACAPAPAHLRGTALGVYNTLQSLGLFTGGAVGGLLTRSVGPHGLFLVGSLAMACWLAVAWPMDTPGRAAAAGPQLQTP